MVTLVTMPSLLLPLVTAVLATAASTPMREFGGRNQRVAAPAPEEDTGATQTVAATAAAELALSAS